MAFWVFALREERFSLSQGNPWSIFSYIALSLVRIMADVASINKVTIAGTISRELHLKNMDGDGTPIVRFGIVTAEILIYEKNKLRTYFHNITCVGNTAIYAAKYAKKGSWVIVHGKIHGSFWKEGDIKRESYNILAEELIIAKHHPFKELELTGQVNEEKPPEKSSPFNSPQPGPNGKNNDRRKKRNLSNQSG